MVAVGTAVKYFVMVKLFFSIGFFVFVSCPYKRD